MKKENSAGAIIFYYEHEPHFLLLKYETYWGFAKGGIETGESPEQTAIRETKEEVGIDIKLTPEFKQEQQWFYINKEKEKVKKYAIYFLSEIPKQNISKINISKEHEDFKFVTLAQSKSFIKISSNYKLLQKAYDFIKNESKR